MLSGCFVLTFGVPTLSVFQDVPVEVVVRLLARSSYLWKPPDSSFSAVSPPKFLAQIPSTHPFVIVFGSVSAELDDVVGCTLLCVNEYSPILPVHTALKLSISFSGHPAPDTVHNSIELFALSVFLSLSLCPPTETEHKSWSSVRGIVQISQPACKPLELLQTCSPLGSMTSRITSFFANVVSCLISRVHWHSPDNRAVVLVALHVQLDFLQMLHAAVDDFPCCLVSPLPLPGPCQNLSSTERT